MGMRMGNWKRRGREGREGRGKKREMGGRGEMRTRARTEIGETGKIGLFMSGIAINPPNNETANALLAILVHLNGPKTPPLIFLETLPRMFNNHQ